MVLFYVINLNYCNNNLVNSVKCYRLAEEWEQLIEEWWFKVQTQNVDLFKWLCIEKVRNCCPENHYGPECLPCEGYPNEICSNNGKCKVCLCYFFILTCLHFVSYQHLLALSENSVSHKIN